jgi:hypothetical protein
MLFARVYTRDAARSSARLVAHDRENRASAHARLKTKIVSDRKILSCGFWTFFVQNAALTPKNGCKDKKRAYSYA